MSLGSRPLRSLPAHPNLEQQKKLARELLRAARGQDVAALERFRRHHPRFAGHQHDQLGAASLALHDAQLVLAREYGLASWTKLVREIETRRAERQTRVFVTDLAYYEERAQGLIGAREAGVPQALAQIRDWHPEFASASDDEIRRAPFDTEAARLVYARQHGFSTWPELAASLRAIAKGERAEPFRDAFDAMRAQQWERLAALVRRHPEVLRARGTNGNSLLNLAVSLAGRTCEALPSEASRGFDLLLDGSDVDQANDRGWTPLHQAAYSNQVEIAGRLMRAGAATDCDAQGEGGTPLAVALFWGNREVADLLAAAAVVPCNLRIAAGLGRSDLVEECFDPYGYLTAPARAGRGFYRPHSGFPVWRPSDSQQEILDEALVWAAKSDRVEVLPALASHGADVDGDPYRGTPLLWAAANGRIETARWLLENGANVNRRATFGGPTHGQGVTALHLAAQSDQVAMARLLLERGADPSIEDDLYHSTPAGWAEHAGSHGVVALLRERIECSPTTASRT